MSSKIKVDTIENVAGSGNVSLGSGHNLVVPGNITGQGTAAITSNATVGGTLGVTGAITGTTQTLNRSGDGELVGLQRGGSAIGSIGTANTDDLYIINDDTGLMFSGGSDMIIPRGTAGAARDNAINLGAASHRFKDLYLSGGLYVGGTDAAHQFHDYEEGTRSSSSVNGITASTNTVTGHYTKIGRQVVEHIKVVISGKSGGSGNPWISLSFTPSATVGTSVKQGGSIGMNTIITNSTFLNTGYMGTYGGNPSVYANDYQQSYYASGSWGNGTLVFTVIYEAD